MFMQTVNRTDVEKVWVNFTNSDGATVTIHHPVVKFHGAAPVASLSTNEAATRPARFNGGQVGGEGGCTIGIAYEDVPNGAVGLCQVYGYHESALVARVDGARTITPGSGMNADPVTLGFNSLNAGNSPSIVAMETLSCRMISANISSGASDQYTNHVFVRAL